MIALIRGPGDDVGWRDEGWRRRIEGRGPATAGLAGVTAWVWGRLLRSWHCEGAWRAASPFSWLDQVLRHHTTRAPGAAFRHHIGPYRSQGNAGPPEVSLPLPGAGLASPGPGGVQHYAHESPAMYPINDIDAQLLLATLIASKRQAAEVVEIVTAVKLLGRSERSWYICYLSQSDAHAADPMPSLPGPVFRPCWVW